MRSYRAHRLWPPARRPALLAARARRPRTAPGRRRAARPGPAGASGPGAPPRAHGSSSSCRRAYAPAPARIALLLQMRAQPAQRLHRLALQALARHQRPLLEGRAVLAARTPPGTGHGTGPTPVSSCESLRLSWAANSATHNSQLLLETPVTSTQAVAVGVELHRLAVDQQVGADLRVRLVFCVIVRFVFFVSLCENRPLVPVPARSRRIVRRWRGRC